MNISWCLSVSRRNAGLVFLRPYHMDGNSALSNDISRDTSQFESVGFDKATSGVEKAALKDGKSWSECSWRGTLAKYESIRHIYAHVWYVYTRVYVRLTDSEEALPTSTPGRLQYWATLGAYVVIKALNYSLTC